MDNFPIVLTIAGSDSGGGAGIQADIKTFTSLCVYGASVITALTAQNTQGVQGVYPVPADFVEQQFESVMDDSRAHVIKTGMLHTKEVVAKVAVLFRKYNVQISVVDPVMVSTSGSRLLEQDAVDALITQLIPMATIVTPNIREAGVLLNRAVTRNLEDMKKAASEIWREKGPKNVLIKGGLDMEERNKETEVTDVLYDGVMFHVFRHDYVPTKSTHGTGCTLASAIAAFLARGHSVFKAVEEAELFVHKAIKTSVPLGKGHGPVNHFFHITPFEFKNNLFARFKEGCSDTWNDYISHEFIKQLGRGTLPMENFLYYLKQDYIFLKNFARANAMSLYKSDDIQEMKEFAKNVTEIINVETDLHVDFCKKFGISKEELDITKEATANMAYTRYVLEQGMSGDVLDLRIAMLPCIAGYGEIAMAIVKDAKSVIETNPYKEWIDTYASDWYQTAVKRAVYQVDRLLESRGHSPKRFHKLQEIFSEATKLEVRFWQMGLTLEK